LLIVADLAGYLWCQNIERTTMSLETDLSKPRFNLSFAYTVEMLADVRSSLNANYISANAGRKTELGDLQ
jgi:hypothetical protein